MFKMQKRFLTAAVCVAFFVPQFSHSMGCDLTVHLQDPGWSSIYINAGGGFTDLYNVATLDSYGWWTLDATSVGFSFSTEFYFASGNSWYGDYVINSAYYNVIPDDYNANMIDCSDYSSGDIYIYENPSTSGEAVVSETSPYDKYFWVLLPENEAWTGAIPMLAATADDLGNGKSMHAVDNLCGWYYYGFGDEEPFEDAYVYLKDDAEEYFGVQGVWGSAGEGINLKHLYDSLETDTIYFIPDSSAWPDGGGTEGIYTTYPDVSGSCDLFVQTVTLNIHQGDITITETGYTASGDSAETPFIGNYAINGSSSEYVVEVSSGTHNIALSAKISAASGSLPAFRIDSGATVYLTLLGTSTLSGGDSCAGLNVPSGASLYITDSSSGTLTARGGDYAAGIGGGDDGDGGTIAISGGTITATGGFCGAGIGGGYSGHGGTITIKGGSVKAVSEDGRFTGAGIGGGPLGDGGIITISGGTVIAVGGSGSVGSGAGIGGRGGAFNANGGDGGTIELVGGIVLVTRGSSSASTIGMGEYGSDNGSISVSESTFLIENPTDEIALSKYVTSGSQILTYDCSWPEGYTLVIDEGYSLTVASGYTFTNYDTIYVNGTLNYGASYGTLVNEGVIIFPDSVWTSPIETVKPTLASVVQGRNRSLKIRTSSPAKMAVYNLRGALVKAASVPAGGATIQGIRPGIYVVKLSGGVRQKVKVW